MITKEIQQQFDEWVSMGYQPGITLMKTGLWRVYLDSGSEGYADGKTIAEAISNLIREEPKK